MEQLLCRGLQAWTRTHTRSIYCLCLCLEAAVLSCPSPWAENPCAACHFSVWQLRARVQNKGGRRGTVGICGGWKEMGKRGKEVDVHRAKLSLACPSPFYLLLYGDQVFSFWEGMTGKKIQPTLFTCHPCTCICRARRKGGGRDKASDKVGLWRLLALLLHHPTADLYALKNTLPLSVWHISLKRMPGFESATQAFLFFSDLLLSFYFFFLQLVRYFLFVLFLWQLETKQAFSVFVYFCFFFFTVAICQVLAYYAGVCLVPDQAPDLNMLCCWFYWN